MYVIKATPVEGSENPRIYRSNEEPVEVEEAGPGSRWVLKFVGHPVPRNTRIPLEQVISVVDEDGVPVAPAVEESEPEDDEE